MHDKRCLLTESENVGINDEESEAEDESDAKVETNRGIQLAPKVSVQPTEGFNKSEKLRRFQRVCLPARDEDPENGNWRTEMRRFANRKFATSNPAPTR